MNIDLVNRTRRVLQQAALHLLWSIRMGSLDDILRRGRPRPSCAMESMDTCLQFDMQVVHAIGPCWHVSVL
jgi:hypothetical protein